MNIIEFMQKALTDFPKIKEVCGGVSIDFADNTNGSCGISSCGDALVKQDILGGMTRKHSFILYAFFQSINDFDRLNNSGILLELAYYLDEQKGAKITAKINGTERDATVTKISAENGGIAAIPEGHTISGVQYQLQINAEYKIESEEL